MFNSLLCILKHVQYVHGYIGSPVREKLLCGPRVLHDHPLRPPHTFRYTRSTLQVKSEDGGVPRTATSMPTLRSVSPHSRRTAHALFSFSTSSTRSPPVPPVPPNNPHTDLTCSPYSAVPTSLQPYDIRGRLWLHVAEIAEIARVAHVLFRLVALVRRR